MTEMELLEYVKCAIGITGKYHDKAIAVYINDLKEYLKSAGVKRNVIESTMSLGTIARGVADIWNLGSGDGILSPYFYSRVIQLAKCCGEQDE